MLGETFESIPDFPFNLIKALTIDDEQKSEQRRSLHSTNNQQWGQKVNIK